MQLFLEFFDQPIEVVTNYIAGLKISRSTAEQVVHKHRDPYCNNKLVHVTQPIKPYATHEVQDQ
jgi:hypothetical protein